MLNKEQGKNQAFHSLALKKLYVQYRVSLIQWLVKTYSIEVSQATELAQSAFAIFIEKAAGGHLPDFKTDTNIKSYLFAIAKNKTREYFRQSNKVTTLTDGHLSIAEAGFMVPEEEAKYQDIRMATLAFRQLGEKCQQLLRLAVIFKQSMQEIAQELNYGNTNTAKTAKYKCLKRLRKLYILTV